LKVPEKVALKIETVRGSADRPYYKEKQDTETRRPLSRDREKHRTNNTIEHIIYLMIKDEY
jgi:hypothetical protein